MASCDIQLGSINSNILSTVENFITDATYREVIENSSNYNTRLCLERKLRMPFLDSQTGVAQNHSNLFMSSRQRMPGLQDGQVYTYPAKRWRKKRRQYLVNFLQPKRKENTDFENFESNVISSNDAPITLNEDSKDSLGGNSSKDESVSKDTWYYEDIEMQEIEGYDEPDPDSDYDYEDSFSKKRKRRPGKNTKSSAESPMRRGMKGFGRGRRRGINYTPDYSVDSDKPYYCDLCGARYKTRPGLTYHYTHSHKDKPHDEEGNIEGAPSSPSTQKDKQPPMPIPKDMAPPSLLGSGMPMPMNPGTMSAPPHSDPSGHGAPGSWGKYQDSYMSFMSGPSGSSNTSPGSGQASNKPMGSHYSQPHVVIPPVGAMSSSKNLDVAGPSISARFPNTNVDSESSSETGKRDNSSRNACSSKRKNDGKGRANPSPYCDFCLGNEESNKKSGQPEELVSCSDCGRSGHPSCLQFTTNMIISVKKYRWQCIECKCCSICGTSDNDDQLLFCDDCDRGYHMYCLSPPLSAPPEGSWSCRLCIEEFHSK